MFRWLLLASCIGILGGLLPHPYSFLGIVWVAVGLLIVVFVGHKSALRQHKYGIFAQWATPGRFVRFSLNEKEKRILIFGITLSISALLGPTAKMMLA